MPSLSSLVAAVALLLALFTPGSVRAQEWAVPTEAVVLEDAPPTVPDDWERVSAIYLEIYGPPDTLPTLMELSRHGSESLPELARELGVAIGRTIHVVVAPTQEAFLAMQPGDAPEWADGTAYPALGTIYLRRPRIRGPARPLTQVFDHELVHVLLGRAFAPQTPPRWLQEGVAQVYSGEQGPQTTQDIARGAALGGLISLEALTIGFPSDPGRARLAYAQSADLVAWLEAEYGEDALPRLIGEMRQGRDFRGAIRAVTGDFIEDVDRRWRARLDDGSTLWLSALSTGDLWWGITGLLAVVGLVLARRRIRRRMDRLAQQEALRDELLAALWQGDEPH